MIQESECFFEDNSEMRNILSKGDYTTLALSDGNDPYIITLSYGLDPKENTLYFLTTKAGTKIDFLKSNSYVCGTVIQHPVAGKSLYHSIVYKGLIEVIHKPDEKKRALVSLFNQHSEKPFDEENKLQSISDAKDQILVMKLTIDEMIGKRNFDFFSKFFQ